MLEKMTMECHNYLDTQSQKDTNGNGIECDIIVFLDPLTGQLIIDSIQMLTKIQMRKNMSKRQARRLY